MQQSICKGNLTDVLSQDNAHREESSTELASPVATPWLTMLDEPNWCNGTQAHDPQLQYWQGKSKVTLQTLKL
jgi:hypothetical protein